MSRSNVTCFFQQPWSWNQIADINATYDGKSFKLQTSKFPLPVLTYDRLDVESASVWTIRRYFVETLTRCSRVTLLGLCLSLGLNPRPHVLFFHPITQMGGGCNPHVIWPKLTLLKHLNTPFVTSEVEFTKYGISFEPDTEPAQGQANRSFGPWHDLENKVISH